jgi:hypothetical protein
MRMKQLFTYLTLTGILLGGTLTACSVLDDQSSGSSNTAKTPSKVLIIDQNTAKYPMDAVTIRDASVIGDSLTMLVAFSGGCRTHDFKVVWDGAMMKSLPGQINVVLSHNANDDMCEALLTQDVTVSLSPLAAHANNGVIIHLKGFDKPLLYQK